MILEVLLIGFEHLRLVYNTEHAMFMLFPGTQKDLMSLQSTQCRELGFTRSWKGRLGVPTIPWGVSRYNSITGWRCPKISIRTPAEMGQ